MDQATLHLILYSVIAVSSVLYLYITLKDWKKGPRARDVGKKGKMFHCELEKPIRFSKGVIKQNSTYFFVDGDNMYYLIIAHVIYNDGRDKIYKSLERRYVGDNGIQYDVYESLDLYLHNDLDHLVKKGMLIGCDWVTSSDISEDEEWDVDFLASTPAVDVLKILNDRNGFFSEEGSEVSDEVMDLHIQYNCKIEDADRSLFRIEDRICDIDRILEMYY